MIASVAERKYSFRQHRKHAGVLGAATVADDAKWHRVGNSLCLMPRAEVELQLWLIPASKKSPALQFK